MASYANTQTALIVDHVPFFASGSIADATNATVTFDNLTERINIVCTSVTDGGTDALLVGVTTAGVEGTARVALTAGTSTGWFDCRLKQVVVRGGGSACGYQLMAVLGRNESATYPDITAANGFAGV